MYFGVPIPHVDYIDRRRSWVVLLSTSIWRVKRSLRLCFSIITVTGAIFLYFKPRGIQRASFHFPSAGKLLQLTSLRISTLMALF